MELHRSILILYFFTDPLWLQFVSWAYMNETWSFIALYSSCISSQFLCGYSLSLGLTWMKHGASSLYTHLVFLHSSSVVIVCVLVLHEWNMELHRSILILYFFTVPLWLQFVSWAYMNETWSFIALCSSCIYSRFLCGYRLSLGLTWMKHGASSLYTHLVFLHSSSVVTVCLLVLHEWNMELHRSILILYFFTVPLWLQFVSWSYMNETWSFIALYSSCISSQFLCGYSLSLGLTWMKHGASSLYTHLVFLHSSSVVTVCLLVLHEWNMELHRSILILYFFTVPLWLQFVSWSYMNETWSFIALNSSCISSHFLCGYSLSLGLTWMKHGASSLYTHLAFLHSSSVVIVCLLVLHEWNMELHRSILILYFFTVPLWL